MAIILSDSGIQTASINVEHQLASDAISGVYVLVVDTSNMALGDILELRIKTVAKSGGTSRVAYLATYAHVQSTDPNKYSIPTPSDSSITCTLKQTAGTGRQYEWSLLRM